MNKRIRKKRKNKKCIKIVYINRLKNQWSTNTPRWKRIKASGRKRKIYYDIHCVCGPTRNHRVYNPALVQKALKEYINEQKGSKKTI